MADVNINKFRASVVRDGSKPASPGFIVSEGQDPVNPPGTNNYVPYSGATANVELGEYGVEAGFITLDTTPTNTPTDQGTIFWDADDETVDIVLNGYTMKIGEDLFYPVKNQTGSTIAKGVAVRFNGTVGNSGRLLIAPFIADGSVASSRFMGVTAEEILNGEDGKVLYFGRVRGINTNAFDEGDILYASTTVAGGYQTAIPVAPNNIVQVAAVVTKSATVGTIFVRPTLGSNINKDEGVKIVSVADKNLLQYQSGTSLWENKSLAQVLGGTSAQFVKGDGSLDSTTYGTGTVTSVGLSSATSGVTIGSSPVTTSGTITLAIATASGSQNGLLSSSDWTTFNSKQNALTNPVTGTGTSGQIAYFTGTSAITSESGLTWDATNNYLNIGGATANSNLTVSGSDDTNIFTVLSGVNSRLHVGTVTTGTVVYMRSQNNYGLNLGINNTDYLSILNTGISVNGNIVLTNGANRFVRIGSASNYNYDLQTTGDDFQIIEAGATPRLTIKYPNGNLLVGTTTDNGAKLQVSGTANFTDNVQSSSFFRSNTPRTNSITIGVSANANYGYIGNDNMWGFRTGTSGDFNIDVNNSSSPINPFKIAQNGAATFNGRVGIGVSPSYPLHIISNIGDYTAAIINTNASDNAGLLIKAGVNNGNSVLRVQKGNGSDLFLVDAGGSVGIGTASPSNFNGLSFASPILDVSGSIQIKGIAANGVAALQFGGETYRKGIIYTSIGTDTPYMAFGVATSGSASSASEYMRITSVGDVYFGNSTVSVANTALFFTKSNGNIIQVFSHSSGTVTIQEYYKQGSGLTGSITYNGTNTLYNATSDYRLKEDLKDYNALQILSKLKTYDFKWKHTNTRDFGMLAHELQEVLPNYVSGQKDELTDDKSVKPQVVDYSKIVPLLIKSIQELKQEIDTLKN